MALVPKFTKEDISRLLAGKKQIIEDAIILRLKRVGETFVRNARNSGTYRDRTGNLRASAGYCILKDGQQLDLSATGGKAAGRNKAQEVMEEAARRFPKGIVLIVVAGMEYAAAVESKGYDVLTGSSYQAEADLKKAIREISLKIGKLK